MTREQLRHDVETLAVLRRLVLRVGADDDKRRAIVSDLDEQIAAGRPWRRPRQRCHVDTPRPAGNRSTPSGRIAAGAFGTEWYDRGVIASCHGR